VARLGGSAEKVYEFLKGVKRATKDEIIEGTGLSEREYWEGKAELIITRLVEAKRGRSGGLTLLGTSQKKQEDSMEREVMGLSAKAKKIWDLIPTDGSFVTNQSLRYSLRPHGFSTAEFWKHRKELWERGLIRVGRGRGGTVARAGDYEEAEKGPTEEVFVKRESILQTELKKWIEINRFPELQELGAQTWTVVLGDPGKWKRKSGHWSRPDVMLVAVTSYDYIQLRDVMVTSYEVKRYSPQMDNSWVFEAASHSKGAHYAILAVEVEEGKATDEPPIELLPDLRQFGVGFGWLFRQNGSGEYDFKEVLEPDRKLPAPDDENTLLKVFAEKLDPTHLRSFKNAIGKA
jgi:hypothetical protein